MNPYNLNESQKKILRWLVDEANAGSLDEEEIWVNWTKSGTSINGFRGSTPEIKRTTLDALAENDFIVSSRRGQHDYKFALTSQAYQAVESNFDAPDIASAFPLIPFSEVKHLDDELWERCRYSISSGGNDPKAWDKAVRTATVILEERLREIGEAYSIDPHATGDRIVNLVFGKNGLLQDGMDSDKAKAYRDLYAGAMLVFRNRYGHRLVDPSPEEGGAIILFIDLLLKMLKDVKRSTS